MFTFIAGASRIGARVASTTAVSRSSAIPAARRAMASAVAGAMISRSASSARRMCPISASCAAIEKVQRHGRPGQRLQRQRRDERVAASVITTRTVAPALTSRRQSSAALYAAMPPVIPSTTVCPRERCLVWRL